MHFTAAVLYALLALTCFANLAATVKLCRQSWLPARLAPKPRQKWVRNVSDPVQLNCRASQLRV